MPFASLPRGASPIPMEDTHHPEKLAAAFKK
jgi:hypothetical protein